MPVQIITSGRKVIVRLLSWDRGRRLFLRCVDFFEGRALC
jgi:hypothetical protein